MTMKDVVCIDLPDLKTINITCKRCNTKMSLPVKDLADMDHLSCGVCSSRLGRAVDDFYLGRFSKDLLRLQESSTVMIGFELTKE
jgi:hypothetical protein